MDQKKKFHFIAIGSSATEHLAEALKKLGHNITTSGELDKSLDGVIIGEQTNRSNPELQKAQQLGLKIYTGAEFIYEFAKNKQRLVVVGTSGRADIVSIIVHVLQSINRKVDYVLSDEGANSISLSDEAPLIVIDGSASRASGVYHTPQFIHYKHHIGIMTEVDYNPNGGLSENDFIRQFDLFADGTPKGGILIYWEQDKIASVISNKERADVLYVPYKAHSKDKLPANLSDKKMLLTVSAALEALKKVGVTSDQFYKALATYKGVQ